MPFTDAGWDAFGQFVAAVGMMAMVAYLLPAVISLSPAAARRFEIATFGLIGIALLLALGATAVWFLR